MAGLSAPGQVSYPPTMYSEASLSFSCAGNRIAEVAFSLRDADGHMLIRLVGATSRSHSGSRRELHQRAKVGIASAAHPPPMRRRRPPLLREIAAI